MKLRSLDNKNTPVMSLNEIDRMLNSLISRLDQKEAIERKIKFFLDIRGYLKMNSIRGSYIEFGSFRSITQYGAYKILDETGMINKYVGLDLFTGEPSPTEGESGHMPMINEGDFSCCYKKVHEFVADAFNGKGTIIQGDFRQKKVLKKLIDYTPINIALIDCNLISSITAAMNFTFKYAEPGCIIFIDDYFCNLGKGIAIIAELTEQLASDYKWKLIEHSFYPPFAKSFILTRSSACSHEVYKDASNHITSPISKPNR